MKRGSVSVFMLLLIILAASPALATGTGEPAKAGGGTVAPVEFLTIRNREHNVRRVIDMVAEEYRKKYDSKFSINYTTTADRTSYLQRLRTLVASDSMPDLFDIDADAYARILADQGLLFNFGKYLATTGKEKVFLPVALDYQRFSDGSMYLMPFATNIEVFWYNKKHFEQAGVTPPKTFDDFMKVTAALKAKGFTPHAVSGRETWHIIRYLSFIPFRLTGNDFINKLRVGNESLRSDVGMKAIQFVADFGKNKYMQEGFATSDYGATLNLFLSGNASIIYMGTWELGSFVPENLKGTVMENNVGYFTLPTMAGAATKSTDMWAGGDIGLGCSAKTFDAKAKGFIDYLLSDEAQFGSKAIKNGPFFPAMKSTEMQNAEGIYGDLFRMIGNVQTFALCWDVVLDPVTNELLGSLINSLALGVVSPEQFADKIDQSIRENAPKYFKQ